MDDAFVQFTDLRFLAREGRFCEMGDRHLYSLLFHLFLAHFGL